MGKVSGDFNPVRELIVATASGRDADALNCAEAVVAKYGATGGALAVAELVARLDLLEELSSESSRRSDESVAIAISRALRGGATVGELRDIAIELDSLGEDVASRAFLLEAKRRDPADSER